MFVIRKTQLEAFRVPLRQQKRDEILMHLQAIEGNKVSEKKQKIIVEDKKGRKSLLHYSEKNLLSAFTKPSGNQTKFEYDEEDRISKIDFPGKEILELTYTNDVPTSLSINGANIQLKYDAQSRLNEIVYPDKKSVLFEYNALNQVSAVIDRVQAKQQYQTVIQDERLVHILKDALGRTTTLQMDKLGGLEKIVFPDNSACEVRYDEVLDAEIVKLRNGTERTTYLDGTYPCRVEWEDGHFQNIELNSALQIEYLENQTGTIGYEYDDQQQLLSESFQDLKVKYQYENDYLSSMVYPSGLEVEYVYDEDDRLAKLIVAGQTVSYAYAPNGTLAEIHYPNGLIEYQTNQILGGLQESILTDVSGEIVSQQIYRYDNLFRLKSHQQHNQSSRPKNWKFGYDDEGRLTEVNENTTFYNESFRYDIKGNLKQVNQQPVEVGVMDELKSIENKTIGYDGGGNVNQFVDEQGRKLHLKYADDGTLKFAKINEEVWEYWYDALGRRVGKSNGEEIYKFFWSGEKLLQEEHKTKNKNIVREYIYTDSNIPVAFKEAHELYWLQRDVRGAVTEVYNAKGKLVWQASYTAFGKANINVATIRQPWRLAGQYSDEETGLHYNLARYYSPYLKTFLSLDPQCFKYEANNYSYAANDPYNRIDINGNLPEWTNSALSIASGIAVGVAVAAVAIAIAPVAAASLVGVIAISTVAGGLGAITESLVDNALKNEPLCIPCALRNGLTGLAFGAILGPVGRILGSAFGPIAHKFLPRAGKLYKNGTSIVKKVVKGTTSKIDKLRVNAGIRVQYNRKLRKIKVLNEKWKSEGVPLQERSKRAYEVRHNVRVDARNAMEQSGSKREAELLRKRDAGKYSGSRNGPTYEQKLSQGREIAQRKNLFGEDAENFAHEYVIKSSQKSNKIYNLLEIISK